MYRSWPHPWSSIYRHSVWLSIYLLLYYSSSRTLLLLVSLSLQLWTHKPWTAQRHWIPSLNIPHQILGNTMSVHPSFSTLTGERVFVVCLSIIGRNLEHNIWILTFWIFLPLLVNDNTTSNIIPPSAGPNLPGRIQNRLCLLFLPLLLNIILWLEFWLLCQNIQQ